MSLLAAAALFAGATLVILVAGVLLTRYADRLADATGLGESIVGTVFLGAATSLSGVVTSVSAAASDQPELAVSNAIGGIAAQTVFIAVADTVYRRVNLEHAAASPENLSNGALLISLLSIPLVAASTPEFAFWGIHPASVALLIAYAFGVRLVARISERPMWLPRETRETQHDEPDEEEETRSTTQLWLLFMALALALAVAGYGIQLSGSRLATLLGLSQTVVGTLMTAVATSLPELVTTITAVRRGALALAVAGIMGGNSFDVLFLSLSDFAYDGSIYHAAAASQEYLIAVSLLMNGVLLLGLLQREEGGFANIGFESALLLTIYVGASVILSLAF